MFACGEKSSFVYKNELFCFISTYLVVYLLFILTSYSPHFIRKKVPLHSNEVKVSFEWNGSRIRMNLWTLSVAFWGVSKIDVLIIYV